MRKDVFYFFLNSQQGAHLSLSLVHAGGMELYLHTEEGERVLRSESTPANTYWGGDEN
jgi:hypothetical protein